MTLVRLSCLLLALGAGAAHAAGDAQAGQAKAAVCASCHGPDGNSSNPEWPKLAGQHAPYLAKQLANFKAGEQRANPLMTGMVAGLSEADMQDLAAFYATQPAAGGFAAEEHVGLGERIYRGGEPGRSIPACIGCHGPRGQGNSLGAIPALSGQHAPYTAGQLKQFRAGERSNDPNGMMRDVARWLTDAEIEAVSHYVAGLH